MTRIFRETFQARDATYGQQRDVSRADAVAFRSQGVPELMQQHASEEGNDESDATPRLCPLMTPTKVGEQYPAEKQDECPMQVNADARKRAKFQRPFHERFQTLRRRAVPRNTMTMRKSQTKTNLEFRSAERQPAAKSDKRAFTFIVSVFCFAVASSFG